MTTRSGGLLERRGAAALVLGLFVAAGVIFVFAGTLARATELEEEAARAGAEIASLEGRLEAGRAEVAFLQTDAFLEQQARALGFGTRGELAFRLPEDAPSPPPIARLGSAVSETVIDSPFEAWLELLFGG